MFKQDIDLLTFFQDYSNREDFIRIFGGTGGYLWRKFKNENYNLLSFYASLNNKNKARLIKALNKAEIDYYVFNPEANIPFETFVQNSL